MKPFLKQYCARCHNADKQTAGVRVDQLDAKLDDRHLKLWDYVLKQTRAGTMRSFNAFTTRSRWNLS